MKLLRMPNATIIISLFWIVEQWNLVESFVFRRGATTSIIRFNLEQSTSKIIGLVGPISTPPSPTQLWLAGRRSTGNKKNRPKTKKKKQTATTKGKKATTKGGNKSKNPMTSAGSSSNTSVPRKSNQSSSKKVAPPWQTISQKDLKKNVKAEKERRKMVQETGKHMTAFEMEETQASYERSKSFLSPEDKALMAWKPFARNANKQEVLFKGAFLNKQMPPRLGTPEVAFLGRSNVGKSSLLNKLVGKSDLARVGKTPGATASVNLYGIFDVSKNKKNDYKKPLMGLVDLPGFGYAKLSKEIKQSVQDTAENYLAKRKELALGILLVDSRRTPTMDDKSVLAALYDMGLPLMVVATKADKYSNQAKLDEALSVINRELGLPKGQPLCISTVTGTGIRDLWKIIMEACEGHVGEMKTKAETGSDQDLESIEDEDAEFYDDGEIAYSQGYDWIQGSVMYEGDDGDYADGYDVEDGDSFDFDDDYDDDYDDEYDDFDDGYDSDAPPPMLQNESLKSLKQRAREMERRGEFGEF